MMLIVSTITAFGSKEVWQGHTTVTSAVRHASSHPTSFIMPESTIINAMQSPLCGTLATVLLYGVICTQVFQYAYNHATSDRHFLRWLVSRLPCTQYQSLIRGNGGVGGMYMVRCALDFTFFLVS